MKILIAIGSKEYSKSTLRAGMKVAQAFNAKATIIDVGEKISAFSNQLVDLAQDQMESWDFDPPGVDVLEWAYNFLSDKKLIDSKQIKNGFPKNKLIDEGDDRKLVYLSGTVCDDVNLILRSGDVISELREEVQYGEYDFTIVGKSQKRNMSHDLLQYIDSSILVVNQYRNDDFSRVLLPIYNSTGIMKVAKYCIKIANAYKIGVDIINIIKDGNESIDSKIVNKASKLIRRAKVDYNHIIENGDVVDKIINQAGEDKIIVMGASKMNPLRRYFKGSIPLSVMNKCNVPILIVK